MSRIYDMIDEAGVFYLATVDGDQPRMRPLGLKIEMDGKIMFGVGNFKDVYREMLENPKVEIVAYTKDSHWLRYTGTAVFEDDPKYEQVALDIYSNLRKIYNEESGNRLMMFHLENATARDIAMMGEGEDILGK